MPRISWARRKSNRAGKVLLPPHGWNGWTIAVKWTRMRIFAGRRFWLSFAPSHKTRLRLYALMQRVKRNSPMPASRFWRGYAPRHKTRLPLRVLRTMVKRNSPPPAQHLLIIAAKPPPHPPIARLILSPVIPLRLAMIAKMISMIMRGSPSRPCVMWQRRKDPSVALPMLLRVMPIPMMRMPLMARGVRGYFSLYPRI